MVEVPNSRQAPEDGGAPLSRKEIARRFLDANHRKSPRLKINSKKIDNPIGRRRRRYK